MGETQEWWETRRVLDGKNVRPAISAKEAEDAEEPDNRRVALHHIGPACVSTVLETREMFLPNMVFNTIVMDAGWGTDVYWQFADMEAYHGTYDEAVEYHNEVVRKIAAHYGAEPVPLSTWPEEPKREW